MLWSDQPCSSSPINLRSGSVESVVFPVPESPKNIAVCPVLGSILAEQCIGSTSISGITKFIIENTLFLISPEYSVPHIIPIFAS